MTLPKMKFRLNSPNMGGPARAKEARHGRVLLAPPLFRTKKPGTGVPIMIIENLSSIEEIKMKPFSHRHRAGARVAPLPRAITVILGLLLFMSSGLLRGQGIDINLVDTEFYPRIKVYVTVTDGTGEVVCRLPASTFRLEERGEPRDIRVKYGEATETSIGLLLDCSGSMSGYIDQVRAAAKNFITLLGGADRACTYCFDGGLHRLYSMVDVAVGQNKATLAKSLDQYRAMGGTQMYSAIAGLIAGEMRAEKGRRKAIVALTDGVSGGSLQHALDAASKQNVAVYTIGMGNSDPRPLRELADKTGGKFYALSPKPTPSELEKVYKDIRNRLRCQYTLIYETPDTCPDGAEIPIEVFADQLGVFKRGGYKRPHDPARIVHNIFFTPGQKPELSVSPADPVECETVEFRTRIRSTSCSDSLVLENVVVRAYDGSGSERIEVAKSKPFSLQSNGEPKTVVVEWNTRGFTGTRNIELVIDPSDKLLERIEEDNLIRTTVDVSKATHDLYIDSIDYSPKPASPCQTVQLTVKVGDGCTCKGVKDHEILVEALDDRKKLFGTDIVSITSGTLTKLTFEWDPQKRVGHIPLTFKVDPRGAYGDEQTRKNNTMQKLIEVAPVLHELQPTEVTFPKKRFFAGDTVPFSVNVKNAGICPGLKMKQQIRLRLKDSQKNRVLGHSQPFSLDTQSAAIVKTQWKTKVNDAGKRNISFLVVTEGIIREQTPPGRKNNIIQKEIEILPMPHDLVFQSAEISPKRPVDGEPASVKLTVKDHARFPGVKLENVRVKAFERYSRVLLGSSEPVSILSQQTIELELPIDTGGMAGQKEITLVLDPGGLIDELTPEGLDGENNNEHHLKVTIGE